MKTHKLFLSKETYETAKANAEQKDQKVEEYINDVILNRTKIDGKRC